MASQHHHHQQYTQCNDVYKQMDAGGAPGDVSLQIQIYLIFFGIFSNLVLLSLFSGRLKLGTASFAYVRITAIVQFLFFLLPFPLQVLTEHFHRGQTWLAANFLPLVLGLFHFAISSLALCFAFRMQMLTNYVRRSRRWSSLGWVAWRKMCWILPFGTIANVSLCFEYNLDYTFCSSGNRTYAIGRVRMSEAAREDQLKMELIRHIPTFIYLGAAFFAATSLFLQRCVLPKLASPYAVKHSRLFANVQPLLLALILSQSLVHSYSLFYLIRGWHVPEARKLTLYAVSYSLPFPLMMIFGKAFRMHFMHMCTKIHSKLRPRVRKNSKLRIITKHIPRVVAYSRLEMENSEIDESIVNGRPHNLRAMLKEDAIYRVRFAMPHHSVITEEDEEGEPRVLARESVLEIVRESVHSLQNPRLVEEESTSGFSEHLL